MNTQQLERLFIKIGVLIMVVMIVTICILWLTRVSRNNFSNINANANSKRDKIDPLKDGKMSFDYLINPNYDKELLGKYYLNDDIIIKGSRLNEHYYQGKHNTYWGFLYNYPSRTVTNNDGTPTRTQSMKIPNLETVAKSDAIYNNYKVRL
jgi:hypothetical protein